MDRRSWILLTALAAVWGASFLFVEIGLRELSPIWVAWGRTVLAALGLFGTGAGLLVFYRLIRKIGPGKAIIVSYLVPGYAVVYGAVLLDEAITLGTLAGLALIVAGSWLAAEGGLRRWRGTGDAPAVVDVVGGIAPGEAAATAPAITRIEPRQ